MDRLALFFAPVLLTAGALSGCQTNDVPLGTPIERVWESPAAPAATSTPVAEAPPGAATQPATTRPAVDPLETIAVINGVPLLRATMADELIRSHGLALLEQHILLTAARQRAEEMGLKIGPADIGAAYEDALKRIAAPLGAPDELPLDRLAAEKLLDEFLFAKNVSRAEWERRMEQQAYLRKIAAAEAARMPVNEEMLREQYGLEYGERVQVRHIQVGSLEMVQKVREALASGKDFELVARQMSENQITAARGGLMAPFTRNDPAVTPLLREAAFTLQPGQVSPAINEGNWYHIMRVERKFPASEVGFENADRQALQAHLLERLTRQRQASLEAELFRSAAVDVRDIELGRQFRKRHRQPAQ